MNTHKLSLFYFLAIALFLSSCKVYRNVENLEPSSSKEERAGEFVIKSLAKLVEGDKILVNTKSGETYFMYYDRLNNSKLEGTLWLLNGDKISPTKTVEIPISEIEEVKVKKFSPAATLAIALAVLINVGLYFSSTLRVF